MLIVIPGYLAWYVRYGYRKRYLKPRKETIGFIWENLRTISPGLRLYYVIFIIRRLIYLGLVNLSTVIYQFMGNSFMCLLYTIYITEFRPWRGYYWNNFEIAQEFVYVILNYFVILFTDITPTRER